MSNNMDIKIGIDVLQCKFKQPTHNLTEARILPCGETVCLDCINSAVKLYNDQNGELELDVGLGRLSLLNAENSNNNRNSSSISSSNNRNENGKLSSTANKTELLLVEHEKSSSSVNNNNDRNSITFNQIKQSPLPILSPEETVQLNGIGDGVYEHHRANTASRFVCKFCQNLHDLSACIENKLVNSIIKQNSITSNLHKSNAELLKSLLISINEKKAQVVDFLNYKLPEIKMEVSHQVDLIKENLDDIEQDMHAQLTDIKDRIEQELQDMPKFNHIIDYLNRTNSITSFNEQQQILSYTEELQRISKKLSNSINSIRFEPNSEILQSSIIGHIVKLKDAFFKLERLQEVKSKLLITSTENDKLSLDVVGLCLDWDSNILISERTEGRLMQLSMNGAVLSKSNFRSEFKNSCGVCVNSKKEILVTDGKLNKIFKFNSNLKLLQIIGSYLGTRYGSLNFPWGITTDIENDDSIYVCDNGNDRILILNSNGEPKSIFTFENCQHPRKIQIIQDLVYILHKSDNDIFVSIFDKTTQQLMNSFKQTETNIKSFYVDSSLNLITIGQLNHENFMQNLICTKKNGQLLFKTVLNTEQIIWDFCFRIVGNELKMICASNEGVFVFDF